MANNNNSHKSPKRGSNILCRVSNPTPEMVVRYVQRLPKEQMPEERFRSKMGKTFFQNEHQAPEQWGLYYIDGTTYYPRFTRDITEEEAERYLKGWLKRLIVINPYTKFKVSNDNGLVLSIVKHLEEEPGVHDLKTIMKDIIGSGEQFIVNDILANTLNMYSEVLKVSVVDKDQELFNVYLLPDYKEIIKKKYMKKAAYFHLFDGIVPDHAPGSTIQTIYYGCPGTGKSHQVKDKTEGLDGTKTITFDDGTTNVFRTTFHPDYDYATFVGCYKPVKEDGVLDYKFVPQVFTNAYVTAKKHPDTPIYLIIEEINRGNCAQIFGDLFQLLDRENGVSKFPINAEEELMKYLRDDAELEDYIKIALPANFNIYATMNTSDQSLFPMDSAFKRRWEMKYIKIDYTNQEANYTFNVGGKDYHWLEYLPCINDKITLATDSEDKQMGEFFIRSNMTATEFKNKVMFYLWNDVCKDLYSGKNSPQSFFFRDLYGNPFKFTELFNELPEDASEEDKKDPRKNGDLLLEGFLYYVKNGKKKAPKTEAITEQPVEEPEDEGEQTAE